MTKDLLKLLDLSPADIAHILDVADQMKFNQKHKLPHRYLDGKTIAMIFEKNSTRTRVSFEAGIYQLGGHGIYLTGKESQIVRGEPVEDTARTLARYCDAIVIRTFHQDEIELLAKYAHIPVINGMTDYSHPCQVLADLMTVREKLTRLEGLNLCYIGDGDNMCNSLIVGGLKCGMNVSVACPEGYLPAPEVLDFARAAAQEPNAPTFTLTQDPLTAAQDADVVFTDVWVSMGKEAEADARRAALQQFQVNDAIMSVTHPGCMVQHCLPAHKGEEITHDIFEAHADEIFEEAENRLHVQKAVLYLLLAEGTGD